MTNIYLAVDYSTRMFLSNAKSVALDFMYSFVDAVDHSESTVTVISFDEDPKVLSEKVVSSKDLQNLKLLTDDVLGPELLNFRALADLILDRQSELTNYEIIIVLETSDYFKIPDDFRFPCAVYFVSAATVSRPNMTSQFEVISRECALQAGIKYNNNINDNVVEIDKAYVEEALKTNADDFSAITISPDDPKAAKVMATALAKKKRTENDATLFISPNLSFEVHLTPGLPKRPFAILDSELLCKEIIHHEPEAYTSGRISPPRPMPTTLHLLGFVKSSIFLLHLPSTSLIHAVKPKASESATNLKAFHVFAEALGSEGQLAIFQHINGEECTVRALRSDSSDPWLMCLQFYSSNHFTWATAADMASSSSIQQAGLTPPLPVPATIPAFDKSRLDLKGISYKANTQRSYWTDSHGIQSDIIKISRLLKRVDRTEQFFQEVQRVSRHAVACGYDPFAESMATMLERRCTNIPPENRNHLAKVTSALRKGGFRLASQTKP